MAQCSISFNWKGATLRGLHYQIAPHEETKIVRCTRGSISDLVLDLRSESPTYKQWEFFELSDENRRMLYIPAGLAHGFITIDPNSEVYYQIDRPFLPEAARGIRWNDPAFSIEWPLAPQVISARDLSYPDFREQGHSTEKVT
jgi:dTDP-4-dehydrorhamnose 3,5-epimerase